MGNMGGSGGAIVSIDWEDVNVFRVTFLNNAGRFGGGIYVNQFTICSVMYSCFIRNKTSQSIAAGIYAERVVKFKWGTWLWCCQKAPCQSYKSCNIGRQGMLCAKCLISVWIMLNAHLVNSGLSFC